MKGGFLMNSSDFRAEARRKLEGKWGKAVWGKYQGNGARWKGGLSAAWNGWLSGSEMRQPFSGERRQLQQDLVCDCTKIGIRILQSKVSELLIFCLPAQ